MEVDNINPLTLRQSSLVHRSHPLLHHTTPRFDPVPSSVIVVVFLHFFVISPSFCLFIPIPHQTRPIHPATCCGSSSNADEHSLRPPFLCLLFPSIRDRCPILSVLSPYFCIALPLPTPRTGRRQHASFPFHSSLFATNSPKLDLDSQDLNCSLSSIDAIW